MNILVIGGSGLVGSNVVAECSEKGWNVTSTSLETERGSHRQLDKTDADATESLIREVDPDAVIDTAAFHAVDECETRRAKAWDVNAHGTRNVAVAADQVDAHALFLSTDYVFPGLPSEAPYDEADSIDPVNYYAHAKYAGEQAAKIADRSTVLRPSVIYGLDSANFVTWALGELEAGNDIDIVDDQISRPTYAPDLATACVEIVEAGQEGVFHATGPESFSRYEFTLELASAFGFETDLVSPISTAEFGQEAKRPRDSSLDSSALYETLGWEFREPIEAFEEMCTLSS